MRYWFPSYPSKIFTVCSPTERSSWVLRAEPWKWKYANIWITEMKKSDMILISWPGLQARHPEQSVPLLWYLPCYHSSLLLDWLCTSTISTFSHFRSTVLCSEVSRRFKTLFLPLHYCSLSSQQKYSFTFGVWITQLKRSVSINMTWIV